MSTTFSRYLRLLLLCAMLAIAPAAAAQSAREFDRLAQRIDDGEVPIAGPTEALAALERLKGLLPPDDPRRARMYRVMRCELDFWHDSAGGLRYAEEQLEEARRAGDLVAAARLQYCRAYGLEATSQPGVVPAYDAGLALAQQAEDPRLVASGLSYRGSTYAHRGEQARALQDLLRAQAYFERAGLDRLAQSNLVSIGIAYRHIREYTHALRYLRQSEEAARLTGDRVTLYSALMQQGYAFEEQGRAKEALQAFTKALELARQSDRVDEGYARIGLANAQIAAGEPEQALAMVQEARRNLDIDNIGANDPMLDYTAGRALAKQGRHQAAREQFDGAIGVLAKNPNPRYMSLVLEARAASREALGDLPGALEDLREHAVLSARLRDDAESQQATLWRMQFDSTRQAIERERLEADEARRRQQIHALERERPWRVAALGLGMALLSALAVLAWTQLRHARRLRGLALSDPLTGIPNRRQILNLAGAAADDGARASGPVSVVTLDLDHFKRVNDAHGHPTGDRVLVEVATALAGAMRPGDHVGRSGGEEFLVVLPRTSLADARLVAERLRATVEALDLSHLHADLRVRTSAGVAQWSPGDRDLRELIRRADAALYLAKENGRNRVEVAD